MNRIINGYVAWTTFISLQWVICSQTDILSPKVGRTYIWISIPYSVCYKKKMKAMSLGWTHLSTIHFQMTWPISFLHAFTKYDIPEYDHSQNLTNPKFLRLFCPLTSYFFELCDFYSIKFLAYFICRDSLNMLIKLQKHQVCMPIMLLNLVES